VATVEAFWPIATYTQITPWPFWLMIVSSAMAVLPVERSPMISSRWPRPIGIMASMALMPVCMRLLHGLAHDDARRRRLDLARHGRGDRAQAVDRTAQRIDHAAHQRGAHGHLEHARGAAHLVALLELEVVAEDDGADVVLLEVQRQRGDDLAGLLRGDLEHLAGHRLLQAVDAGDAVLRLDDGADVLDVELVQVSRLDLAEQDVLDLAGAEEGLGSHGRGDVRMSGSGGACRGQARHSP
jgi:hypothetical protein